MFIPKILKKMFDWLNMTLNGSPSYVFWTLHVDFQTLHRSIPWMSTSKRYEDDGNHGGREERVSGVVDYCWRQLIFNKFWLAIKRGEVQNLKGKNTVKNSKIECLLKFSNFLLFSAFFRPNMAIMGFSWVFKN